jgi:hypothetical protein
MHAAPFTTKTGVFGRASSDLAILNGGEMVLAGADAEEVKMLRLT